MPKKEGAASTRKTVKLENVEGVASFLGVWENFAFKKPCQIEGCGHIISGVENKKWKAGGPEGEYPWITCGEGSGAGIVHDRTQPPERHDTFAVCVCCVDKIGKQADEYWRAVHGDPE